jgi:uncharacterized membrane protein
MYAIGYITGWILIVGLATQYFPNLTTKLLTYVLSFWALCVSTAWAFLKMMVDLVG